MAGIGFELKKIYRKEDISHAVMGTMYSFAVTIGPTLIVIITILFLYMFLDMTRISIADRELLSSTILYVFIFSCCLSAPFNSVFSRYIADKFYKEELNDIIPSYYAGLLLISAIAMIMGLPILFCMRLRGNVDIPFLLGAYVLWASAVILFFSNTFLQGTKDYKIIARFFTIAMVVAAITAIMLYWFTPTDQIHSILYGLALGFFIIAFCEFAYIRYYFRKNSGNYAECLDYIKRYWKIVCTNLFYTLGLYVHNFVMWTTPGRIIVANTLVSHQAYDMATCLAMFSNITATVIFTVVSETEFHEKYQQYMEAVLGGTFKLMQKNKTIMFHTLSRHLSQIFSMQVAITCLIYLFLHIFGLSLGFSSLTMIIYPVLAVAYLGIFVMYSMIVFLYYFEDTIGSMLTAFLFFVCTWIGTYISKDFYPTFYGAGVLFGMLVSMIFAFLRLRAIERNFETHIFCKFKMIETKKTRNTRTLVYKK